MATHSKKSGTSASRNWWEDFFVEEFYHWWGRLPHREVGRHVEHIQGALDLSPHSSILDVACGLGLHMEAFCQSGYDCFGIDWSEYAVRMAAKRVLPHDRVVRADMRALPFQDSFDAAFITGGSFGYFSDADNIAVLGQLRRVLKPSGVAFLEMPNRDSILRNFNPNGWIRSDDDTVVLLESRFDQLTSRLEDSWTLIRDGKTRRSWQTSQRLYAPHELAAMCERVQVELVNCVVSKGHSWKPESERLEITVRRASI